MTFVFVVRKSYLTVLSVVRGILNAGVLRLAFSSPLRFCSLRGSFAGS